MSDRWKAGFIQYFFDPLDPGPANQFGPLYAWGQNDLGQLGNNTTVYRSSPIQVGALTNWSQVSGGQQFVMSIKVDGTLWACGDNTQGKLGLNDTLPRSSPVQVGALTNWAKISSGNNHCLAIKTDGTLWSWGINTGGCLGQIDLTPRSSPTQVGALTDWAQVAAGAAQSYFIKTNGTLWSVGSASFGRLGDNTTVNKSSPVQIGALTNWIYVGASTASGAAIKTDGTLWTWGDNGDGAIGDGTSINRSSPVQVGALDNWSKISCGLDGKFCMSLKTNGTLWGWGNNLLGQLGDNTTLKRSSPVQVGSLTTWSSVSAANGDFTLAIKTDKTLWVWGSNQAGQIGDNADSSKSSPVQVGSSSTWIYSSGGSKSSFAIQGS